MEGLFWRGGRRRENGRKRRKSRSRGEKNGGKNGKQVTWKSKLKAAFPNPNDYSAFMGDFSSSTGAVTFMMMIASRFIFRRFGW